MRGALMVVAGMAATTIGAARAEQDSGGGAAGDAVVLPLQPYAGRLVTVSATLGPERLTLLLDTGGGQTLITPAAAGRVGCAEGGRSVGFRMTGERVVFGQCDVPGLEIGGHRFPRSPLAVWDVMSVLPKDLPPLDGVLALDTLAEQPFTLHLEARTLTLESPRTLERRVASMTRLRARIATGIAGADLTVFVRGALQTPGWFLFDSGNLDRTCVAPHMARGAPVASRLESAALAVEGLPPRSLSVKVRDIIYDGVLAEEFLREWIWTFRLARGELWAAPAR